jgi:hypothetical protein
VEAMGYTFHHNTRTNMITVTIRSDYVITHVIGDIETRINGEPGPMGFGSFSRIHQGHVLVDQMMVAAFTNADETHDWNTNTINLIKREAPRPSQFGDPWRATGNAPNPFGNIQKIVTFNVGFTIYYEPETFILTNDGVLWGWKQAPFIYRTEHPQIPDRRPYLFKIAEDIVDIRQTSYQSAVAIRADRSEYAFCSLYRLPQPEDTLYADTGIGSRTSSFRGGPIPHVTLI